MKRLLGLFCVMILSFAWCSSAGAVDLGFYVDGASGSGEAEWESDTESWDIDSSSFGIGFALDTATTNQSFFNYRLNAGYASQVIEDADGVELESGGISIENVFGFALAKNEKFRWWLGPLVRVGYYSGETDDFAVNDIFLGAGTAKVEADYAEFGIGVVTGVNFNINNKLTLAPSVGVRVTGFAGEGTTTVNFGGTTIEVTEDLKGNTTTGFVNLAVLF